MINEIAFDGGRLRWWEPEDADRLVLAWADAEIARWNQVPAQPTIETAQRWISGHRERFDRRLAVDMVIVAAETNDVVGEVGLSGFNEKHRGALIGYWLLPLARGAGLASGAVTAFVTWAHRELELDVVVAKCHESNIESHAVVARSGFEHESTDSSGYQLWRSRTRVE